MHKSVKQINIEKIANIGGWHHEFESGDFFWTDGHYEIFELPKDTPHDQLFIKYQERIHPDDLKQIKYLAHRAETYGEEYVFSHRIFFDDGHRIKYVKDTAKVNKDANGKPISMTGVCQDITDAMLLQEQSRFVLQSFSIGLWQYDITKKELIWDDSNYKLYNLNPQNFKSAEEAWRSVVSAETVEKAKKDVFSAIDNNKEYLSHFDFQNEKNDTISIGIRGTVIKNTDGQPIKIYGMSWDRTQDMLLEKSLEIEKAKSIQNAKLASLGEMSASVAHEINNPLAVISAILQLIKKVKDDPIQFEQKIVTLKKSVDRISKIVNGLRKFSKSGNQNLYKEESIEKIISEALVFVDYKLKKHEIELKLDIQNNYSILCDPLEIEQVIINLISNAADAIKNLDIKWIQIKAFQHTLDNNEQTFHLQIIDSGLGISQSEEDKIFQPFYTTKQLGEGTGLGLSIAKGLLEQHKAKIQINRSFQNTCFEIIFSNVVDSINLTKIVA